MGTLKSIYKHKLKEKQVEAFLLQEELKQYTTAQNILKLNLQHENSSLLLPSYFNSAIHTLKTIDCTIHTIKSKLAVSMEEIREMFIESKKLEIYYSILQKKKARITMVKSRKLMDEAATQHHMRRDLSQ